MVGAIIQVLVAEQAAPSFVTEAVPGLLAGPVETAWIPLTLVTKTTFPPAVTPANKTCFGSRRVVIHREAPDDKDNKQNRCCRDYAGLSVAGRKNVELGQNYKCHVTTP
jgi:hypothetical protein